MLLMTPTVPAVREAFPSAACLQAQVGTVPVRVTYPSFTSTVMSSGLTIMSLSRALTTSSARTSSATVFAGTTASLFSMRVMPRRPETLF